MDPNDPAVQCYTILLNNIEEEPLEDENIVYLSMNNDESPPEQFAEDHSTIYERITLEDGTEAFLATQNLEDSTNAEDLQVFDQLPDLKEDSPECTLPVVSSSEENGESSLALKDASILDSCATLNDNNDDLVSIDCCQQVHLLDGSFWVLNSELDSSLFGDSVPQAKKKSYQCETCQKCYATYHHLQVHSRVHTGSKPYQCKEEGCEKAFSTNYSLKAHLRVHTGEKPYACKVCKKSFKISGDLLKHMRTHTGEKPFACPIEGCNKSFTTSNIRKVHIRSHTGEKPYLCSWEGCNKAFASMTNFKNHVRIHSGEKPFACVFEGCGKSFTEYSSLYKHQVVHCPFTSFECDICGRVYRRENSLNLHKSSAHKDLPTDQVGAMVKMEKVNLLMLD